MLNYIYRKRVVKNRYGITKGKQSIQFHFGKRSLYLFVPFYNITKIVDKYGKVTVS
jgi:hypothetical protein